MRFVRRQKMNPNPSPRFKMSEMISEIAAGFIRVGKTTEEKRSRDSDLTEPKQFNAFGRLSPDGNSVLYCSLILPSPNDPGGWHLHILDIATGKSSKVGDTPKMWQPKGGGI